LRPLVYEASLGELVQFEEYVPNRAFVQLYGSFLGRVKLDYALFLGNSPNIRTTLDNERVDETNQTGVDTTSTMLVGGRIGVRYGGLKAGFSATRDHINDAIGIEEIVGGSPSSFEEIPRIRLGWDLSYDGNRVFLEGEAIVVRYLDGSDLVLVEREFIYGTVGYYVIEPLMVYVSYWYMDQRAYIGESRDIGEIYVSNLGAAYSLDNGITLKAQVAHGDIDTEVFEIGVADFTRADKLNLFSVAISFIF
jgi:hypothetical protein